ncbi:MAG: hypothetical protein WD960_00505 [Gemmatimonadota bacterium]
MPDRMWTAALVALVLALGVQVARLHERTADLIDARDEVQSLTEETRDLTIRSDVFEQAILAGVSSAFTEREGLPATGIYVIASGSCAASLAAIRTLASYEIGAPIRVASYDQDQSALQEEIADAGLQAELLDLSPGATFLSALPRYTTPAFLIFASGSPEALYLGQPEQSWFDVLENEAPGT